MYEHGASGRKFAGRAASGGHRIDGHSTISNGASPCLPNIPDDLKEVVYTMRFDEASAEFAEFGAFYTGLVADSPDALTSIGLVD